MKRKGTLRLAYSNLGTSVKKRTIHDIVRHTKEQETIPVEYQQPSCQPYILLHNEVKSKLNMIEHVLVWSGVGCGWDPCKARWRGPMHHEQWSESPPPPRDRMTDRHDLKHDLRAVIKVVLKKC